jgi:hypothetical protein
VSIRSLLTLSLKSARLTAGISADFETVRLTVNFNWDWGGSDGKIGRGWQKMVKACRKAVKNGSVADINEAESCLGCLDKLLRHYHVRKRSPCKHKAEFFLASRWHFAGNEHHRKGANGLEISHGVALRGKKHVWLGRPCTPHKACLQE